MPEINNWVLFASNYTPALGKVIEVHLHNPKPVVVNRWERIRPSVRFPVSKFKPSIADDEPVRHALTLSQIKLDKIGLNEVGFVQEKSRPIITRVLRDWVQRS